MHLEPKSDANPLPPKAMGLPLPKRRCINHTTGAKILPEPAPASSAGTGQAAHRWEASGQAEGGHPLAVGGKPHGLLFPKSFHAFVFLFFNIFY